VPKPSAKPSPRVNLLDVVKLLHKHCTEALCRDVFQKTRRRERQKKWTLYALARFRMIVVMQAPKSLTRALQDVRSGLIPFVSMDPSATEGFFAKCKAAHFRFFRSLFEAFLKRVLPQTPATYAKQPRPLLSSFTNVWAVDGSKPDNIRHRLKILWKEKATVLPGCLTVYYDLFRGIARHVLFDPDAASGEQERARSRFDQIPKDTLILGDRAHCNLKFFLALAARQLRGLFRLHHQLTVKRQKLLSRKQGGGRGVLEDWIVLVGSGVGQPPMTLRLIVFSQGPFRRELLTNVLDPAKLPAQLALETYPFRWGIERLFFDLREVCHLNTFYAANVNAVAMQVYAAALVHTAFRIAQARIARKHGLAPEALSPAKLFPRLASTSFHWTTAEMAFDRTQDANPSVVLKKPEWAGEHWASTTPEGLLVEKRKSDRRKIPRRTKRKWKSLAHVPKALTAFEELS
jgi:hypothetical protein